MEKGKDVSVMLQEGMGVATEMLCGGYADRSARTAPPFRRLWRIWLDLAAKTMTDRGANREGMACAIM